MVAIMESMKPMTKNMITIRIMRRPAMTMSSPKNRMTIQVVYGDGGMVVETVDEFDEDIERERDAAYGKWHSENKPPPLS